MSKILPQKQNLLPVCLKRKLDYTGNYIEEVINRNKVNAYFNFFKWFNPLFTNTELSIDAIDAYEIDCDVAADTFENAASEADKKLEIIEEEEEEDDTDSIGDEFDPNLNTFFQSCGRKMKK